MHGSHYVYKHKVVDVDIFNLTNLSYVEKMPRLVFLEQKLLHHVAYGIVGTGTLHDGLRRKTEIRKSEACVKRIHSLTCRMAMSISAKSFDGRLMSMVAILSGGIAIFVAFAGLFSMKLQATSPRSLSIGCMSGPL